MSPHHHPTSDHASRPTKVGQPAHPPGAPHPFGANHAESRPEVIARLEWLDDLMFAAIDGDPVALEPITTNLAYPSENWIRLEVALMFNGPPDVKIAEDVHQDIMAYLRTVSLQQVEGPRGFQYLRDDIQERVDLRSDGRVTNVMFRTFVIQ